jgi:nitroimidazol reductase NimA-like FMN-containing flavoprotein (pyridoxamine 5'-phosphate oxidase superfamily)
MIGTLEDAEVVSLLEQQSVGRLGCTDGENLYVVPISYAYVEGRILGQTSPGRKIEYMRIHPEICLEVDEVKTLTNWRSVILWGEYHELEGIEAAKASGLIIDRLESALEEDKASSRRGREVTPPRLNHAIKPQVVYEILIREKTGRFERPGE